MNIKQFLKPDIRKLVLFIILILLTNYFLKGLGSFTAINMSYGPWDRYGYPFIFLYEIKHFLGQPIDDTNMEYARNWFLLGTIIIQESSASILGFNIPLFILDILIFYIISCFVFWIYDKLRKK